MTNMLVRADDDPKGGWFLQLWCPACEDVHAVSTKPGGWTWDGDLEVPTISPSLLVRWQFTIDRPDHVCHSFVRAGQWEFLSDSTHALAGQTVPLVPLPDVYAR